MSDIDQHSSQYTEATKLRVLLILSLILVFPLFIEYTPAVNADFYSDLFGNVTTITKPVPAVPIGEEEIPIGGAKTFIYSLTAGQRYHVYLTGEWANPQNPLTDYDIYVYWIDGSKVIFTSSHTESCGLPEQVGNDANGRYFTPTHSGLYYFKISNDALESSAAESGTLMVLENIDLNKWKPLYMEGKVNNAPRFKTSWSYEFVTSTPRIKVYVDVPTSLDMYEARLYIMGNPGASKGEDIKDIPIAWEPGLNAQVSGVYGGYNLEQKGYRRLDAMASCETNGQDMIIDFETPLAGETLYHLAFIAEYGEGEINFIVQTDFDPPEIEIINPQTAYHERIWPKISAKITDESTIEEVAFSYSVDGETWTSRSVTYEGDSVYSVVVPPVNPKSTVEYKFSALDPFDQKNILNMSYEYQPQTDFRPPLLTMIDFPTLVVENKNTWLMVNIQDESSLDDVSFFYTEYGGITLSESVVYSHGNGNYSTMIPPVNPGVLVEYAFTAIDDNNLESEISGNYTTIGMGNVNINLGKTNIFGGDIIIVTGIVYPVKRSIQVIYTLGEDIRVYNLTSNGEGHFTHTYSPPLSGDWRVQAEYLGEEYYLYSISEQENFTVSPVQTTINCQVNTEKLELGNTLTISGMFSYPKAGLSITIYLTNGEKKYSVLTSTHQDGSFSTTYVPDEKGKWQAQTKAFTDGLFYSEAESSEAYFNVVNPTLTTTLLRLPERIYTEIGWLLQPPYLYGIVGLVGVAGGGVYIYWRRQEE